jgi:hypothetical protein
MMMRNPVSVIGHAAIVVLVTFTSVGAAQAQFGTEKDAKAMLERAVADSGSCGIHGVLLRRADRALVKSGARRDRFGSSRRFCSRAPALQVEPGRQPEACGKIPGDRLSLVWRRLPTWPTTQCPDGMMVDHYPNRLP